MPYKTEAGQRAASKKYYEANKEKIKVSRREYQRRRYRDRTPEEIEADRVRRAKHYQKKKLKQFNQILKPIN